MSLWLGAELGLKYEFRLSDGIPQAGRILQQPACSFKV